MADYKPFDQEKDPLWNREPGVAIVPGSNYQREMAKFEQFPHDKWAFGNPGNPYTYRPYPKMLFRAQHWNGKVACMAAPPNAYEYKDPREFERDEIKAQKFTEQCQMIVNDDVEQSRAMENGWRESPQEAVEYLLARDRAKSEAAAHLAYEDRNLSEPAQRERAAYIAQADEQVAEIPAKPLDRMAKARAAKAAKAAQG